MKLCVQGKRKGRIRLNSIQGEGERGNEGKKKREHQVYRWSLGEKGENGIKRDKLRDKERERESERERPTSIL